MMSVATKSSKRVTLISRSARLRGMVFRFYSFTATRAARKSSVIRWTSALGEPTASSPSTSLVTAHRATRSSPSAPIRCPATPKPRPKYSICSVSIARRRFGWSLGGHVGMEMLPRFPGMVGHDHFRRAPFGCDAMEAVMAGFKPIPRPGSSARRILPKKKPRHVLLGDLRQPYSTIRCLHRRSSAPTAAPARMTFENLMTGGPPTRRRLPKIQPSRSLSSTAPTIHSSTPPSSWPQISQALGQSLLCLRGPGHAPLLQARRSVQPDLSTLPL